MLINMSINSKYNFWKVLRAQGKNRMLGSVVSLELIGDLQLEVRQKLWEIPKKALKYTV